MNSFEEVRTRISAATNITLRFEFKRGDATFQCEITESPDGGWQATLQNMDNSYDQPIVNKYDNSFEDILHEIRMHTLS